MESVRLLSNEEERGRCSNRSGQDSVVSGELVHRGIQGSVPVHCDYGSRSSVYYDNTAFFSRVRRTGRSPDIEKNAGKEVSLSSDISSGLLCNYS